MDNGKVWLVGAGTGDAGLITVKGMEVLQHAEVVVFDALISLEILALMPRSAELVDAGKRSGHHNMPQEEINAILLKKAKEGKRVVRLKGGDPFVFGRGGEELQLIAGCGIDFEIVPGITSAIAVPAYNGIPLTHRDYSSSFYVVTGHKKENGNLDIDFKALARLDTTLVFLMGAASLDNICQGLLDAGMDKDMPAAVLERGTTFQQKKVVATLQELREEACKASVKSPLVIVTGKTCSLDGIFSWYGKMPLSKKQVLVTRQESQAQEITTKLRALGAHVFNIPVIETVPINTSKELGEFYSTVDALVKDNGRKCIVFTSPQGVKYFFGLLKRQRIDTRKIFACKDLDFAVIGAGTGKALEEYGIFADYMPGKYTSKELGRLLAATYKSIYRKRDAGEAVKPHIYIFRAAQGSYGLTEELMAADIPYTDTAIYHTLYNKPYILSDKICSALDNGEISYVIFTSASTVRGFANMFTGIDYKKTRAVCIGDKTAEEAVRYGMEAVISEEASVNSLVAKILEEAQKDVI